MREIYFSETLVFYDKPYLILCKDSIGVDYICLLVTEDDTKDGFLCVQLSSSRLTKFIIGEIELRDIFVKPEMGEYFFGNSADGDLESVAIQTIGKDQIDDNWYPETGVRFSFRESTDLHVLNESKERNRAIIHCTLSPPEAAIESKISATHLSEAVNLFQSVVKHAYRRTIRDATGDLKEILTKSVNYELEIYGFSPGSFTLLMQSAEKADLVGYSYIARALEILDNLNNEIDDTKKALKIISEYSGHFATTYKNLLKYIIDNEIPLAYEWSMPERKDTSVRRIIPRDAKPLYEAIIEVEDIGVERMRIRGRFSKVDKPNRRWTLDSEEDQKRYSGISETDLAGIVIHSHRYDVICEEYLREDVFGKESTELHLISFQLID
jgi:hypothetical protein